MALSNPIQTLLRRVSTLVAAVINTQAALNQATAIYWIFEVPARWLAWQIALAPAGNGNDPNGNSASTAATNFTNAQASYIAADAATSAVSGPLTPNGYIA
jgi:hypothetical protein